VPAPHPGKPDRVIVGLLAATLILCMIGRSIGLGYPEVDPPDIDRN